MRPVKMFHKLIRLSTFPQIVRSPYFLFNKSKYAAAHINRFYSNGSSGGPKKPEHQDDLNKKCPPDPSKMDQLPKPECPWDETQQAQNKKYTRHLLLGLLVAAATLATLWYNMEFTKKTPAVAPKKPKIFKRPKPTCREPQSSSNLPEHVPYLLIGGGTASFSAFRAIKSADPTAKVLVISNECYFPYMRPPLSKEMWFHTNEKNISKLIFKQWNGNERSLFYEPDDFYTSPEQLKNQTNGGVAVAQGYTVERIDVSNKVAYLDDGKPINYDKCLIATGAQPKNLEVFKTAKKEIQDKVTLFRDIFDYQELDEICKDVKSIAVIGSGFLGSELACALGKLGKQRDMQVYQIYREAGNMGKILPEYLSTWTTNKVRREMVTIINKTEVEDVSMSDNKKELILHLSNGDTVNVGHVIVAVGVEPNTQLAKTSDLEVDPELGGYLVNAEMEARSNLYAAGDCSCFYDTKLGRRRVEHHDHAVVSGRLAGENMTGAAKPYLHQSMFWSDLGPDVGYEAIGRVDSSLPTVGVFAKATDKDNPKAVVTETNDNLRSATEESAKPVDQTTKSSDESKKNSKTDSDQYGKGVIFYLKNDIVVGIVLWNVFNRMSLARQVLKEERKYDDLNEVAKLFNIHEE